MMENGFYMGSHYGVSQVKKINTGSMCGLLHHISWLGFLCEIWIIKVLLY